MRGSSEVIGGLGPPIVIDVAEQTRRADDGNAGRTAATGRLTTPETGTTVPVHPPAERDYEPERWDGLS